MVSSIFLDTASSLKGQIPIIYTKSITKGNKVNARDYFMA